MATVFTAVKSSQISRIGFDKDSVTGSENLTVVFKDGDGKETSAYVYNCVSQAFFKAIVGADSVGKQFDALIKKGGFSYRKLDAIPALTVMSVPQIVVGLKMKAADELPTTVEVVKLFGMANDPNPTSFEGRVTDHAGETWVETFRCDDWLGAEVVS